MSAKRVGKATPSLRIFCIAWSTAVVSLFTNRLKLRAPPDAVTGASGFRVAAGLVVSPPHPVAQLHEPEVSDQYSVGAATAGVEGHPDRLPEADGDSTVWVTVVDCVPVRFWESTGGAAACDPNRLKLRAPPEAAALSAAELCGLACTDVPAHAVAHVHASDAPDQYSVGTARTGGASVMAGGDGVHLGRR